MVFIVQFKTFFCPYILSSSALEEYTTSDELHNYNGSIEFVD
jgi:hypothetical protein